MFIIFVSAINSSGSNEPKGIITKKLNRFLPLKNVNVRCLTCRKLLWTFITLHKAIQVSVTTWKTEDMQMLIKYCCLFLKALVTVQGLLGDGDLPYTSADGEF